VIRRWGHHLLDQTTKVALVIVPDIAVHPRDALPHQIGFHGNSLDDNPFDQCAYHRERFACPDCHKDVVAVDDAQVLLRGQRERPGQIGFVSNHLSRVLINSHGQTTRRLPSVDDRDDYFFSLSPQDRRAYSEQMATNFADPMTASWPNWAKVFFNNKGVTAKETENCANYPPDDASVWDG
jgi:hypothetical protein